MAPPPEQAWREGILPRELRRQADAVRKLAHHLSQTGDFPTETPSRLCELIRITADVLAASIPQTPPEYFRHVNEFLRELMAHLRYADRSRLEETPWSMVQVTEAFFKQQIGNEAHFIIRPQWAYNYGLVSEFVAVYKHRLSVLPWIDLSGWTSQIDQNSRIYCISFPRVERLNALLHTCWGHEVGHILAQDWTQLYFNKFWLGIEPQVSSACKQELQKQKPPTQDQLFWDVIVNQHVAEWTKKSLEVARFGLNELLSDAVGVHLFGPAAFAASAELCAQWDLDTSPLNAAGYPPWRYRLRLLSETCEGDLGKFEPGGNIKPGLLEPLIDWLRSMKSISAVGDDNTILQRDARTREPYNAIQKEWPDIRAAALSRLPLISQPPYRLSERAGVVQELVARLEANIPPDQSGIWPDQQPAVLADILNAGWAFKLKKIKESPAWGSSVDFENLFRLVLKAVEASHVQVVFGPKLRVQQ
jgi:hypothetical protein